MTRPPPDPTALLPDVALAIRGLVWPVHPGLTLAIPHLDLPRGRITALLGRSASGKSTLLRAMARVDGGYFTRAPRASGQILAPALARPGAESPDLLSLTRRQLMVARIHGPGLGFVFQQEGLFPDRDALGNVRWALDAHGLPQAQARAAAALATVGLTPDRAVGTLSGGERKRLALARCLALEPRLLLLDEPFTGLDPEALRLLYPVLAAERDRGTTIVLVTHQRDDVCRLADHLVFLEAGQVVADGPRESLEDRLTAFFA
jgi:ABC-type multidrug transport system ATPase subunit